MTIDKALEDFTNYKVNIEGKEPKSLKYYTAAIRYFLKYNGAKTYDDLLSITASDIKDWINYLASNNKSPATRNNWLTSIKQFYKYLENEKEENIDGNISKIKYAKAVVKETKYLDREEVAELIRATNDTRTKSAIAIIVHTGVRISELMQLTCADIERGYAIIKGKGNKERKIFFSAKCLSICNKYISGKRKKILEKYKVKTDLLFISNTGKPLKKYNLTVSLKNSASKIGLYWSSEMSAHKLRHSCLTMALNDGVPIQVVRDMAGHASIGTTNRYSHSKEEDVRSAMLRGDL